ncbi:MAG TPA: tyrosine-protein phosphatase [Tepidisphaeraceae bacterium]|jgi:protein tyrosine phosphatase (PTP) superfamily phosphohydrolase (DUF442 family)|nr:tyrosine-protein phosphatase [Tepidisphaeraceae bacterium]
MPQTIEITSPVRRGRRKLWWITALPAVLALFVLGWYLGVRFVWFNVHEVVAGEVYRSSQPSPAFLARTVREKNIHSILKLNPAKESDWSREEAGEAKELGVKLINVTMGVSRLPTREELVALVEAVDTAPRPMLVHCKIGADRTGVASMLVAMRAGESFEEAAGSQLNWRFMHIGHFGPAVEDIVPRYREYCAQAGKSTGGWAEFVDFTRNHYDPVLKQVADAKPHSGN